MKKREKKKYFKKIKEKINKKKRLKEIFESEELYQFSYICYMERTRLAIPIPKTGIPCPKCNTPFPEDPPNTYRVLYPVCPHCGNNTPCIIDLDNKKYRFLSNQEMRHIQIELISMGNYALLVEEENGQNFSLEDIFRNYNAMTLQDEEESKKE